MYLDASLQKFQWMRMSKYALFSTGKINYNMSMQFCSIFPEVQFLFLVKKIHLKCLHKLLANFSLKRLNMHRDSWCNLRYEFFYFNHKYRISFYVWKYELLKKINPITRATCLQPLMSLLYFVKIFSAIGNKTQNSSVTSKVDLEMWI